MALSPVPSTENQMPHYDVERHSSEDTRQLSADLKAQFHVDARASDKWRRLAKEWYAMRDGDQWDADTWHQLRDEQRPALTFNRTASVLNMVCGLQTSNQQEVRIYPRSEGDAVSSDIANQSLKWIDDRCGASSEEARAFRDMLTCGIGFTETRIDYLDDPKGKTVRERVYPLSMFWDKSASKRNLADAKRIWRIKVVERSEAIEMFPDVDPSELDAGWTGYTIDNAVELIDERVRDYREDNHSTRHHMTAPVRLVQVQWWQREMVYMLTTPDGQTIELPKEEVKNYRGLRGFELRRIPKRVYHYAILGQSIITTGPLDPDNTFHFKAMTADYDEQNGYWFGMMRAMMDPQRWQNKTVSNLVHILSSMGKGGLVYETGAFVNPEKAKRDWAKSNPAIELTPGSLGGATGGPRFIDKPTGQLPGGIGEMLDYAQRSIYECAGVPFELLSQDVSDQLSGVQEFERKRAGITLLAEKFDALRLYRVQQARLTFDFIRAFHQQELIRIVEEGEQKYVPIALDPAVEDYDFVIDDAPDSPNQKERNWQLLQPLLPIMLQMQAPAEMWSIILQQSPLPQALVQKMLGAQDEEPTEEEQQERQLLLRQAVAELAKTESEARENIAKAQKALAGATLDAAKASDLGYRQKLDTITEVQEMKMAEKTSAENTKVVDIQ